MKPNANLYRLNAILDFTRSQQEFLHQVGFFNPEPQIVSVLKFFPDLQPSKLTRLITWHAVNEKGQIHGPLFDLQSYQFRHSLKQLLHELNEATFMQFLKDGNDYRTSFVNFKIVEIKWFLKLWEDKNIYAPNYAPKRLSSGLKFVYVNNKLTTSFQKVSTDLWLTSDHNPTTVIPLTHENFDWVINQHVQLAKEYLQNKEK